MCDNQQDRVISLNNNQNEKDKIWSSLKGIKKIFARNIESSFRNNIKLQDRINDINEDKKSAPKK